MYTQHQNFDKRVEEVLKPYKIRNTDLENSVFTVNNEKNQWKLKEEELNIKILNLLNQVETHEKSILDLNKNEKSLISNWEETKKELSGEISYVFTYLFLCAWMYMYINIF
jgi:predicted  nucleic acid-binding Zn-ribbon protein